MAHVRKDTYTKPPQWWKHLKEYKRVVAKAERISAKKLIEDELIVNKSNPQSYTKQ